MPIKLLAGDCTGYDDDGDGGAVTEAIPDNQIASNDINAISAAFNTMSGDSAWNAYCDFDNDGRIYVSDLNYSVTNYGGVGIDGEGILYKGNDGFANPSVEFVVTNETSENVSLELIAHNINGLHAYAVPMYINPNEWEIVSINDGLSTAQHNPIH